MNIRCIIAEDEPLARNLLKEYVSKVPFLTLVAETSNPLEALEILSSTPVDLLFLDIQMPEITGITLLKILQKKPLVILTTAYSEYAIESYEFDVVDYLLKPITFDRFLKSVDKASQRLAPPVPDVPEGTDSRQSFFFVKDGTKLVKIVFDEILYVEGLKDYVIIHTTTKKITTLQRIKNLESQLPANKFFRIHNSFIVSLPAIDTIYKEKVQIGKTFIPISDSYKKQFREMIGKNNLSPGE